MITVTTFKGRYNFLSNFYDAKVWFEGDWYRTVEHAYQASKTVDEEERVPFKNFSLYAGSAKKLGQTVTLRPDWEEKHKLLNIWFLVWQKFFIHKELREKLLSLKDANLIEGNYWHDNFWGECRCLKCKDKQKFNHLGHILMHIRAILKYLSDNPTHSVVESFPDNLDEQLLMPVPKVVGALDCKHDIEWDLVWIGL